MSAISQQARHTLAFLLAMLLCTGLMVLADENLWDGEMEYEHSLKDGTIRRYWYDYGDYYEIEGLEGLVRVPDSYWIMYEENGEGVFYMRHNFVMDDQAGHGNYAICYVPSDGSDIYVFAEIAEPRWFSVALVSTAIYYLEPAAARHSRLARIDRNGIHELDLFESPEAYMEVEDDARIRIYSDKDHSDPIGTYIIETAQ